MMIMACTAQAVRRAEAAGCPEGRMKEAAMEIISIGKSKELLREFPEHRHGYWEVLLNSEGEGVFEAGGESWLFSAGTIAVIPPYTPHSKRSESGFTDRSVFLKNFRDIGPGGVRVFSDDERGSVGQIFDMAQYFFDAEGTSEDGMEEAVLDVLGDLLYQVLVSYYTKSRKRDIRLEGAVEMMHMHISDPEFDIADAVSASGYSEGYFRKIFREMTGQSPVTYFHMLRITYACSLFQQYRDSRSVKDVALQSGFEDPLYFSRVFKQIEGVSPQRYVAGLMTGMTEEDKRLITLDTPKELL